MERLPGLPVRPHDSSGILFRFFALNFSAGGLYYADGHADAESIPRPAEGRINVKDEYSP